MDIKRELTRICTEQLGWPNDPKTVAKNHLVIWQNARTNTQGGLRLTEEGCDILQNRLQMKSYKIDFPDPISPTNKFLIEIDRFVDSPYYLTKNNITVFKERTAIQLVLYSGDLRKFITNASVTKKPQT